MLGEHALLWECSECGSVVHESHPLAVCPYCGLAGSLFVPAEDLDFEDDPFSEDMRESWLQRGLQLRSGRWPREEG